MKLHWMHIGNIGDLAANQIPIIRTAIIRKGLATFPWSKFAK